MSKIRSPSASLEREVIFAVVVLYLLISGAMLAIHYLQPAGPGTTTSSMSPSHDALADRPPAAAAGARP